MNTLLKKTRTFLKIIGIIKNKNEVSNSKFYGTRVAGDSNLITIGENVSFSGEVNLIANTTIEIGDHTMIAYHVIIHTSTHDYKDHPMWTKRIDRPVKIGKHVWIGTGAIISPGVIIEDHAVIGAGSVVTSNVPAAAIVGGNPARIISYRRTEDYMKPMKISKWEEGTIQKESFLKKQCIEKQ